MSWVAVVMGVTWVADKALGMDWGGKRASARASARGGAGAVREEKLAMLAEKETSALEYADYSATKREEEARLGTGKGVVGIRASSEQASRKANMRVGQIDEQVKTSTKELLQKYTTEMTDVFKTREMQRQEADFAKRSGELSTEQEYQQMLGQIENY